MRTHYDNLKIAENAPDEVVRAAYRALSQRFHPDKNPGDPNAQRVMQILNASYATLSDPVRRREYDASLSRARAADAATKRAAASQPPVHKAPSAQRPRSFLRLVLLILFWDFRITLFALFVGGAAIAGFFDEAKPQKPYTPIPPATKATKAPQTTSPTQPAYVRPTTAPNGEAWPVRANYIPGYPIMARGGLSSVTIDNTQNQSDVFLKLVSLDSAQAFPVRVCFIPARSTFRMQSVEAGRYDVRYRDLESGGYSKTEDFTLRENRTAEGTEFSNLSLTLYEVVGGNMHTERIDESEF